MNSTAIWNSATTKKSAEYTGCGWRMTPSADTTASTATTKKTISAMPMSIVHCASRITMLVSSTFTSASGRSIFQPSRISWS